MERLFSKNETENINVANKVLKKIADKGTNILFLKGDLGAGKTTLTSEISKILNCPTQTSSPTYVIQKMYDLNKNKYGFNRIIHIDLYRLKSVEQIEELDLFEDFKDLSNLYIVEWPEPIIDNYKNAVLVKITEKQDGREFIII